MNRLSQETSPYLLQHKNNPVDWYPWCDEAWQIAKQRGCLVLVSIGYSACHWCHVMEHEVFEDFECAEFMNKHFVCIKVDREERPDVDGLYMDAVHLMGGRGGWPLNVFCLPDARPVYGGTYFPKQQWLSILDNLFSLHAQDKEKMEDYATRLHEGLAGLNISDEPQNKDLPDAGYADELIRRWSQSWDYEFGGAKRAPKFPMPDTLNLLLIYGERGKEVRAEDYLHQTLRRMARGGLFDQIGGGFARYSVDAIWKVPHFEKMLYDNAQLLVTYSRAYRTRQDDFYLEVIEKIIHWLHREMRSPSGLYFAAMDADSEGEEGKYYVWTEEEVRGILKEDYPFAASCFGIGSEGYWEEGKNILLKEKDHAELAREWKMTVDEVRNKISEMENILLHNRSQRVLPGLDDKCLTSWNALLIQGFCEAGLASGKIEYIREAEELANAVLRNLRTDKVLYRTLTKGKASIPGFLDDYAFLAQAFISLYECGCSEEWLLRARDLAEICIAEFYDPADGLFFYSSEMQKDILVRRKEMQDNVIASSNAVICSVLSRLSRHLEKADYAEKALRSLGKAFAQMDYAGGYSRWLQVFLELRMPKEVVVTGSGAAECLLSMQRIYYPGVLFAASTEESELPLFRHRNTTDLTIYVCTGGSCLLPVHSIEEAEKFL